MPDEELDKLFKDAVEKMHTQALPHGAWDEFFEKKLKNIVPVTDAHDASTQKKPLIALRWPVWVAAAVVATLILGAGLWYIYFKTDAPGKDITINHTMGDKTVTPTPIKPDSVIHKETPSSVPLPQMPGNNIAITQNHQPLQKPSKNQQPTAFSQYHPQQAFPVAKPQQNVIPNKKPDTTNQASVFKNNITKNQPRNNNQPLPENAFVNPPLRREKTTADSKWQLGVMGGANLGMVQGNISGKPGVNAGVIVQNRINRSRFSIESGVVYESMTYAVANENFNPGGKPVSSRVSNIEGACSMLNVPVNVRYDVTKSKKKKTFVSTGVSPTMMLKQSYVYDFTDENGTRNVNRDVTGQGKNVYAVANFSIGFEQTINKVSVQVAPYVKVPLGEVGYGNLNLGGIGTQVLVKRAL